MDRAVVYVYAEDCVGVSVSAEQAGEKWKRERKRERSLSEITSMTHGRLPVLFPIEWKHHILCPLALWHPLSERASPTSPRQPTLSLSLIIFTLSLLIRTLTVKSVEFQVCVKIFITDDTLSLLLLSITCVAPTFIHLVFFICIIFILKGQSYALMLAGGSRHSLSRRMQIFRQENFSEMISRHLDVCPKFYTDGMDQHLSVVLLCVIVHSYL